jgi:hypothetical protein
MGMNMANISRDDDLKDLELRIKNNGNRPHAKKYALGCMFHIDRDCGCPRCGGLKERISQNRT